LTIKKGSVRKTINIKIGPKMGGHRNSVYKDRFGLKKDSNNFNRTKELKSDPDIFSKSKMLKGDSEESLRIPRKKSSESMLGKSKSVMSKGGKYAGKGAKFIYKRVASEASSITESDNKDSSDLIKSGSSNSMKETFSFAGKGIKKGSKKGFSKLFNSPQIRTKLLNANIATQQFKKAVARLIIKIVAKVITAIISALAPYLPVILLVLSLLIVIVSFIGIFIGSDSSGSGGGGSGGGSSGSGETVTKTLEPGEVQGLVLERGEVTEEQDKLLNYALSKVGYKYSQPKRFEEGYFDCSSFAFSVEKELGKKIPSGCAADQAKKLTEEGKQINVSEDGELLEVSEEQLEIGDLIYYGGKDNDRYNGIHHVSVYVGNGYCVEAYTKRLGVVYQPLRIKEDEPMYVFRP